MKHAQEDNPPAVNDGNRQEVAVLVPDSGTLAWSGYLLVAASVAAGWAGLVDGPGAALSAYTLLLLGVSFISLAMIAPAKLETI